ncbi:MAG: hypothetical protein ACRCTF_04750 [Bacteroidales bacterium]
MSIFKDRSKRLAAYSQGVNIMRSGDTKSVSDFFYYFLLFVGMARMILGSFTQGALIMGVAIVLFLWQRGSESRSSIAINISEDGLIIPKWGLYRWEQISGVYIEHYADRGEGSYNIIISTRDGANKEIAMEGLVVKRLDFQLQLQKYAPSWVDIVFV